MSMTLVEYGKTVENPVKREVIETLYKEEPLFQLLPIEFTDQLAIPYVVEKSLPGVAFRKINEAFAEDVGVVQRLVEVLKPFGGDSDTDTVIANRNPAERRRRDLMRIKATGVKWVQSIIYGNSPASRAGTVFDDVDGIDGLQRRFNDATGAPQVVDMGGTGSDGSSILALRFGDTYLTGLMTNEGIDIRNLGEMQTKPVYRTRVDAVGGLAVYNGAAGAWLKDATVATPVTIAKLDELVDLVTGRPDVLIMSKRTKRQLKTNAFTLGVMAFGNSVSQVGTLWETYGDIPIVTSDALIDTETAS